MKDERLERRVQWLGCPARCALRVPGAFRISHFAFRISHFAFRISHFASAGRFTLRACEPHASDRVGGGSVPPAHPARLISAWTAEIRGRSVEVRPRNFGGPNLTPFPLAAMPSTRAVSHRPNPPPTLSQAPAWQGDKYRFVFFGRVFWHRRAIEAATIPAAGRIAVPTPFARTTPWRANAPLCVRRGRAPSATRCCARFARGCHGAAGVGHRWRRRRQRLVGLAIGGGAWGGNPRSRQRPVWTIPAGIVAASMARRCQKPL
jgi:hypothetical protein